MVPVVTPEKKQTTRKTRPAGEDVEKRSAREKNREKILAAIINALNETPEGETPPGRGWNLTKYAEVGGTTRGTLYNHFGSLEGLLAAIHKETKVSVNLPVRLEPGITRNARIKHQVGIWTAWIDNHRSAVISTLFTERPEEPTGPARLSARMSLNRQIVDEHLGVSDPSINLLFATGVYIAAAEEALRGYLILGWASRDELAGILDRLLRNVIEMGRDRDDVPKPLPGDK